MTNRERFEAANIIKSDAQLTDEQEKAIYGLSQAEVECIIAVKDKVSGAFPPAEELDSLAVGIILHHH